MPNLQVRSKWQKDTGDLTVGAVVLMMDPQLPRGMWQCGMWGKWHIVYQGKMEEPEPWKLCVGGRATLDLLIRFPSVKPDPD